MNLYLISQSVNGGYDTYDSAVVAAPDEKTAARINPSEIYKWDEDQGAWGYYAGDKFYPQGQYGAWAYNPGQVTVQLIGTAVDGFEGIICASFNAG